MRLRPLEAALDRPLLRAGVRAHLQVLEDGQLGEELAAFGDVGDAQPHDLLRRTPVDPASREGHRAPRRRHQAGDGLEWRRFTRAIGPEQRDDRALRYLEGYALGRLDTAVEG